MPNKHQIGPCKLRPHNNVSGLPALRGRRLPALRGPRGRLDGGREDPPRGWQRRIPQCHRAEGFHAAGEDGLRIPGAERGRGKGVYSQSSLRVSLGIEMSQMTHAGNHIKIGSCFRYSKIISLSLKDEEGHVFATRTDYVMVIGKGKKPVIGLPRDKGLRKTILEEAAERHSS